MKRKLLFLLCALLTMIGVQAQATFTETYTLTGKGGDDWSNILKAVPSDGLRTQNFEVAVNGTNGHLLVWGGTTDGSGVHYGDNWRDMAFRNVTIGDKVAFTISDATKLDQVKLNSNTDKVSYVDEGATRTFTVNQSGVSVLYLARATDNICVTQIQYTYQMPSGFTKVTSADDLNATNYSNNFYVFSARENPHLVLRLNVDNAEVNTDLDYQTQNVSENLEQLWTLEKNGDDGFSMRNVKTDHLLLQTEGNNKSYCIRLNDQPNVCEWTKLKAEAADGFFKIQNTKYSGNYLGLWTPGNDYVNDADLAGNKTAAAQIGHFNIYAIPRSTFNAAYASSHTDITDLLANPAVKNTTGWTGGNTNSGQQYTGAPDNTYMDTYNQNRNQNQTIALPSGYYLLKAATRAHANVTVGNIYAHSGSNLGSTDIHHEGSSGNLLGNGWGWTRVPFYVDAAKNVSIGFYSECGSAKWAGADDFHLTYYTSELEMKKALLNEVVSDANAWADKVTTTPSLDAQLRASAPTCSTVDECNTAITNLTNAIAYARATSLVYPEFVRIKNGANLIKNVATTSEEACETLASAITTQTAAAEGAITEEAITTATSTLKAAIKTYVNAAEPKNDGEYFDITCLIENPTFENNNATGWSGDVPGFQSYHNAEFFNKNFDFYQNISGLANGSYQLSVQAFCRPGDNGNETAGAYYDYTQGISNITAELYVNSDASTIGNIYSYKGNTTAAKVDGNDFHCNIAPDDYWVPNNMKGAGLYFEDGAYNTTVAALVEDGNLKIGFREENKKTNQWVIFDNFRLYYYGSSKLVYYKQYLPQLKAEVTADLSNGAYANVLVSSEDEALDAALAATPASETEGAYKTVIDNIKDAQTAFRAAAPSYDAMVAAKASSLTKFTSNIGTGIFQYNETTNNTLFSAYETAKAPIDSYTFTTSSTAAGAQTLVDALDDAIDEYNNQPLNAPNSEKRYNVSIVEDEKAWDGNAVTFIAGGRNDQGNYAIKYKAAANEYMNQALKFTAVAGEANTYKVSAIRVEDGSEQYLATGTIYGGNDDQIRTTDDASKAMKIKIEATSTANQFQLRNVAANKIIANNNNESMYTAGSANFTIAEASKASVTVAAKAGKYGTIIFPFTPDISTGFDDITFYSVKESGEGNVVIETIDGTPKANTPYVINNAGGSDFSKNLEGWGTAAEDSYTDEGLTGVYTAATIPADAGENKKNYVLQTQGDVQQFYFVETDFTATAYRAYMTVTTGTSVKALNIVVKGEKVTGIDGINEVENEEYSEIYNAAGVPQNQLQKGLNIVRTTDGQVRKVFVK